MSTVIVEHTNANVVKMTWLSKVSDRNVRASFREINNILSSSQNAMYVIVDILSDPKFPIGATLTGALFGPYRNPNLIE